MYRNRRHMAAGKGLAFASRRLRWRVAPRSEPLCDGSLRLERRWPGVNYRHLLGRTDIELFLSIMPNQSEILNGLRAIVLAPGTGDANGWHVPGLVGICAWPRNLKEDWETEFARDHADLLDRLEVQREPHRFEEGYITCHFNEDSARGFQLLHVLLHELGHHGDALAAWPHDPQDAERQELHAEEFAHNLAERIWEDYVRLFGIRRSH